MHETRIKAPKEGLLAQVKATTSGKGVYLFKVPKTIERTITDVFHCAGEKHLTAKKCYQYTIEYLSHPPYSIIAYMLRHAIAPCAR